MEQLIDYLKEREHTSTGKRPGWPLDVGSIPSLDIIKELEIIGGIHSLEIPKELKQYFYGTAGNKKKYNNKKLLLL